MPRWYVGYVYLGIGVWHSEQNNFLRKFFRILKPSMYLRLLELEILIHDLYCEPFD